MSKDTKYLLLAIGVAFIGFLCFAFSILFTPAPMTSDVYEYLGTSSGSEVGRSPAANWDEAFESTLGTPTSTPSDAWLDEAIESVLESPSR